MHDRTIEQSSSRPIACRRTSHTTPEAPGPPARTSQRADSPEYHKKLLLLNSGQAQVMKTKY